MALRETESSRRLRESLGDGPGALSRLPAEHRDEARERAMFADPVDAPDEGRG